MDVGELADVGKGRVLAERRNGEGGADGGVGALYYNLCRPDVR